VGSCSAYRHRREDLKVGTSATDTCDHCLNHGDVISLCVRGYMMHGIEWNRVSESS